MNKRFLFIGPDADDYKIMYKDFQSEGDGIVFWVPLNHSVLWTENYIKESDVYDEIANIDTVIVAARVYEKMGKILSKLIRRKNMKSNLVLYMSDVVFSYSFELKQAKEDFDFVFTYDEGDAKRYCIYFCQEPFSYKNFGVIEKEYDLCFVGSAKNRLNKIINIFENATKNNLKCLFYIFGVEEKNQKYSDKIKYNCFLDFESVIQLAIKSRCVLEILEEDMYSPTTRFAESILYGSALLSDSKFFVNKKFENVFYFSDEKSINWEQIINLKNIVPNPDSELFSLESMKKTITKVIENEI